MPPGKFIFSCRARPKLPFGIAARTFGLETNSLIFGRSASTRLPLGWDFMRSIDARSYGPAVCRIIRGACWAPPSDTALISQRAPAVRARNGERRARGSAALVRTSVAPAQRAGRGTRV